MQFAVACAIYVHVVPSLAIKGIRLDPRSVALAFSISAWLCPSAVFVSAAIALFS